MSELDLEARVAELLGQPVAGRLPDAVVAGLCVWWLRRRGVLKATPPPPAPGRHG